MKFIEKELVLVIPSNKKNDVYEFEMQMEVYATILHTCCQNQIKTRVKSI